MEGILFYNQSTSRPDILLPDDEIWGGLRCGECFEYLRSTHWTSGRLEYDDDWFLLVEGRKTPVPYGSSVRQSN